MRLAFKSDPHRCAKTLPATSGFPGWAMEDAFHKQQQIKLEKAALVVNKNSPENPGQFIWLQLRFGLGLDC